MSKAHIAAKEQKEVKGKPEKPLPGAHVDYQKINHFVMDLIRKET